MTNMLLHGIEVPMRPTRIEHGNTLQKPLSSYGRADQVDVVLSNPPFGGTEQLGIESNFPATVRTRETADLSLVLIVKLLSPRRSHRAGSHPCAPSTWGALLTRFVC